MQARNAYDVAALERILPHLSVGSWEEYQDKHHYTIDRYRYLHALFGREKFTTMTIKLKPQILDDFPISFETVRYSVSKIIRFLPHFDSKNFCRGDAQPEAVFFGRGLVGYPFSREMDHIETCDILKKCNLEPGMGEEMPHQLTRGRLTPFDENLDENLDEKLRPNHWINILPLCNDFCFNEDKNRNAEITYFFQHEIDFVEASLLVNA